MAGTEKLVQEILDAWNRMDEDVWAARFTEDAELYLPRNLLEGGGYHGHEGVRRAMTDAQESWDVVTLELRDIRVAGDRAVVHARATNRSHSGGPELDYETWLSIRFEGELMSYCRSHLDEADALGDARL